MTTTMQAPFGARRFQLSRIAELTFDGVRQDFVVSFGLTIAILIVPMILRMVMLQSNLHAVTSVQPGHMPNVFGPSFLFASLIGLIASVFVYAVLSWRAVERLQGRTPTIEASLEVAFRALPVLIAVAILGYVALVFATVLLIFPALMLATAWLVAIPAAACEQTGVIRTFGRSAELTKGHRWTVFGFMIVLWLGSLIVTVLGALLIRAMFGLSGNIFMAAPAGPLSYVALILQFPIGVLVTMVFGTGVGVMFQELRASKGGFDARRLSDVFA